MPNKFSDAARNFRLRRSPADMIVAATRARLAGDWRGACEAALVEVDDSLSDLGPGSYSLSAALAVFAPDLLRQYLPQRIQHISRGTARLPEPDVRIALWPDLLITQIRTAFGPPRLRLSRGDIAGTQWTAPDWCWRADATAARKNAYRDGVEEADAVRGGLISPDELHPLVRAALFGTPDEPTVTTRWTWPMVPVRCHGIWHAVQLGGGTLTALNHPDPRSADGGSPTDGSSPPDGGSVPDGGPFLNGASSDEGLSLSGDCGAVIRAWRDGTGWLPRGLRKQRNEMFRTALLGRTGQVLEMLDAGFDPAATDGSRASLMHYLGLLDAPTVLPRLLAAGLSVDAADHQGETPLHHAVRYAAKGAVTALLAAGADPDRTDQHGRTPDGAEEYRRTWPASATPPQVVTPTNPSPRAGTPKPALSLSPLIHRAFDRLFRS